MKPKFITACIIFAALSVIACRQDDVLIEQEESNSIIESQQVVARDSLSTDPPPKDKDHWKTAASENKDTIKTNPPKASILLLNSSNFDVSILSGDDGTKPPKDKDHWRTK